LLFKKVDQYFQIPELRPKGAPEFYHLSEGEYSELLSKAKKSMLADVQRKLNRSIKKSIGLGLEPLTIGTVVLAKKYKPKEKVKWGAIGEIYSIKPGGLDFVLKWKTPGLDKEAVGALSTRTYSRS
jgi:hypothetical protein